MTSTAADLLDAAAQMQPSRWLRGAALSRRAGRAASATRHAQRVSVLAVAIAHALSLDEDAQSDVELGGFLHDVGKAAIPPALLKKRGALTAEEWEVVRRHPGVGAGMIRWHLRRPEVAEIVLGHHERWDGSGYPNGLEGAAIPIGARVVAVADAFFAMTERRPYRPARGVAAALSELAAKSGTQFDPACVAALRAVLEDGRDIFGTEARHPASVRGLPLAALLLLALILVGLVLAAILSRI